MAEKKQAKGLSRNTIDKFYTKPCAVELCMGFIQQTISINPATDLIIEPSAGNGAFIPSIKALTEHAKFYDLKPENSDDILEQDYLELDTTDIVKQYPTIHIIGNPPFGRQSSLAIKFIKKSCQFATSLSFILPKSFKKESMKARFPPCFHLLHETDLPDKSFLVDGVEYDVPCVFQIWLKKDFNRPVNKKVEPSGFEFVKRSEQPDISFRRVGVNAGTVDTAGLEEKSEQSHYFIRFTNGKTLKKNVKNISKIKYAINNTVGPRSISKQELIKEFIMVL
jgi:hypothetical protein